RAALHLRPHRRDGDADHAAAGPGRGHGDRGLPRLRPHPRDVRGEVQQQRQLRRLPRHPVEEPLRLGPGVLMDKRDGDLTINLGWLALAAAAAWLLDQLLPARSGPDAVLAVFNVFVQIGIMILSALISYALTPKPKPPKPASITDFDIPTAEEGREIPVVFGEVWITGPNVLWYGDLKAEAIRKKAGKK